MIGVQLPCKILAAPIFWNCWLRAELMSQEYRWADESCIRLLPCGVGLPKDVSHAGGINIDEKHWKTPSNTPSLKCGCINICYIKSYFWWTGYYNQKSEKMFDRLLILYDNAVVKILNNISYKLVMLWSSDSVTNGQVLFSSCTAPGHFFYARCDHAII